MTGTLAVPSILTYRTGLATRTERKSLSKTTDSATGASRGIDAAIAEHLLPTASRLLFNSSDGLGARADGREDRTRHDASRVERSLYERANGYNFEAVKIFMPAGANEPVIVHYTEHLPPDPTSAMLADKTLSPSLKRGEQLIRRRSPRLEARCPAPGPVPRRR
jgi:hypothetical protein